MSEERETKRHGSGIYSRWSKRDKAWHYFTLYRWTPPTEALDQQAGCGAATQSRSTRANHTYTLVHEYDLPHPCPAEAR